MYLKPHVENIASPVQPSYLAYALNEWGLSQLPSKYQFVSIDAYWDKVVSILDATGNSKYTAISTCKMHFSLSHGNSYPERSFSITEIQLDAHGTTIDNNTLIALCFVKDYLHKIGARIFKFSPETN